MLMNTHYMIIQRNLNDMVHITVHVYVHVGIRKHIYKDEL